MFYFFFIFLVDIEYLKFRFRSMRLYNDLKSVQKYRYWNNLIRI